MYFYAASYLCGSFKPLATRVTLRFLEKCLQPRRDQHLCNEIQMYIRAIFLNRFPSPILRTYKCPYDGNSMGSSVDFIVAVALRHFKS